MTRSLKLAGPDLVEIACGGMVVSVSVSGAEVVGSHDHNTEQSLVARNWKLLTTLLCLAHSSLQESQLMTRNHLVGIHYTGTCTVYITILDLSDTMLVYGDEALILCYSLKSTDGFSMSRD